MLKQSLLSFFKLVHAYASDSRAFKAARDGVDVSRAGRTENETVPLIYRSVAVTCVLVSFKRVRITPRLTVVGAQRVNERKSADCCGIEEACGGTWESDSTRQRAFRLKASSSKAARAEP